MKTKKILLNALPLLFVGGIMAYAAAPAGGYLPNATLDPDCAPNDTDCFVQLADDQTSVWNNADGTNADETSTDINYVGGNVGIGTTAPSGKLDIDNVVFGEAGIKITKAGSFISEANNSLRSFNTTGTTSIQFGVDEEGDFGYIQSMEPAVSWVTRNLILQGNGGNVGIGTTTPGSKLSIVGLPSASPTGAATAGSVCIDTVGDMYIDASGVCN